MEQTNNSSIHNAGLIAKKIEAIYAEKKVDTQKPEIARLGAWIALEALSPQTYRKSADLVNGDRQRIVNLSDGLPWSKIETPRKNYKLYYEVILGAIDLDIATQKLVSAFGDDEGSEAPSGTKAILGSFLVDENGYILEEKGVAISSLGWALPLCLQKRFSVLSGWPEIEHLMIGLVEKILSPMDKNGKSLPVDMAHIQSAYTFLVEGFNLPHDLVSKPEFGARVYHYFKSTSLPECSLLNSFFLADLARAIDCVQTGSVGEGLAKYLSGVSPVYTYDLLKDDDALEETVAPTAMPSSRWPMNNKYGLVLLQQAAVNMVKTQLKESGIAAINGPPGTGKTTLLRDVISHAVVERASALSTFDDPLEVFASTGQAVPSGGSGSWHIYKLAPKVKGHEILVASSNNAAIENISHELPDLEAISDESLSYFRTVSDCLAAANSLKSDNQHPGIQEKVQKSWGLISAALGNSTNRAKFQQAFWWDKQGAMRLYLKAAKGDSVIEEIKDPKTKKIIKRLIPAVVTQENPPINAEQAKSRWKTARKRFLALRNDAESLLAEVDVVRTLCLQKRKLLRTLAVERARILETGNKLARLMPEKHGFKQLWSDVLCDFDRAMLVLVASKAAQPHWLQRLLRLKKGRLWLSLIKQHGDYMLYDQRIARLRNRIEESKALYGSNIIDDEFFARLHTEKQVTPPWGSERLNALRGDVFGAALELHKAFVDVSAQKLLHNLSVLMGVFSSGSFTDPDKRKYLPDLWSTLFLVVPVVSTTFASVKRMLGDLPNESLGWLLIDEAGQAAPQAAVGAIMRAKRTVVVGDPMQIQPVVTLPQRLISEICGHFRVDSDAWAGPVASTQALADQVSVFQSTFDADVGPRQVGMPLLVHRRCENPMFSISNEVAYNGLMVSQVKQTNGGSVRQVLGPSAWISVDGEASTKWCSEEGAVVIDLLRQLRDQDVCQPDLFIITPFRIVALELRRLLNTQSDLLRDLGLDARTFAKKRVGTVHTVQGREADTVILLLGAPKASQDGARRWAGSPANLLNVAVSRAKHNLYVIGSHDSWATVGSFATLSHHVRKR